MRSAARGLALAALLAALGACARGDGLRVAGGDPSRAKSEFHRYGRVSCHTIPGVPGARSRVGPPLAGIARRTYIAGVLPNGPENLVRWIRHPQGIDTLTAMPDMGVTDRDARDMASYLYTLR